MRVFRFAGGEFIVLKATDSPDGLDAYLANVGENLDRYNRGNPPYPLSLSYGKSFFEEGSLDEFIKQVDNRMYKMKQEHHAGAQQPHADNDALYAPRAARYNGRRYNGKKRHREARIAD